MTAFLLFQQGSIPPRLPTIKDNPLTTVAKFFLGVVALALKTGFPGLTISTGKPLSVCLLIAACSL